MINEITNLFEEDDSYIFQFDGKTESNITDRVQLIASLTKPIINYYVRSKMNIHHSISNYFETSLPFQIEDLLMHRSGVWDYLEHMAQDEINESNLADISLKIIKNSDASKFGNTNYSNSGFVLLSRLVEIHSGNSFEDELVEFYKNLGVKISFDYDHEFYLTGWGDGAAYCDVENYFKMIQLEKFERGMGRLEGKSGKVWMHGGFVPGFETLVAYNEQFKLVYFKQDTPELSGITDKFLDILEK